MKQSVTRPRVLRSLCKLWVLSLLVTFLVTGVNVSSVSAETVRTDSQTVLSSGLQLEQERNWKEAIQVYQDALKVWKDNQALQLGLRRARFNYAIDRRYLDASFKSTLKPMTREAALELYDDVVTNIQGHFLEPLSTTTLVAHGTESLWLALGNEKFVDENLFGAAPQKIEALRRTLYEQYWNKPVPHRFAAQNLIEQVSELCYKQVGLEPGPVVLEYTFGACNCLDDYSNVLTPTRRKDLNGNIKGEFVGIGIVMEGELGAGMALQQVLPNSPAAEAGLRRDDVITAVNGTDCRFLSTEEAADLLSGKEGSSVQLTIQRDETPSFAVTCVRRPVELKSIPCATIIDSQHGVGYIQMTGFQQNTVAELDAALRRLHQQGMKSLVWDLRENPGGLLDVAVEVADRFISSGTIVSTKGREANQSVTYAARPGETWKMPLVLLIDEKSASASEIIAGAIRDHQRGQIVGRQSFGKWSVQTIYSGRFGTSIRLTTARFYSPNGDTYGKVGLKPDMVIEQGPENRPLGDVDLPHDPDLQAALRLLTNQEYTQR